MSSLAVLISLVLLPGWAIAHPGAHQHPSMFDALLHFVTEPDHLAMLALVIALAFGLRRYYRQRSR
jgi:hydrogenase/urease accessory protein HupE